MDENSKKIRELTEAMRAERDIRIRNRMMAVLGVLKGHSTKIASDFADMDQRTVQLWVARFDEGGIGGLRDTPGRGRTSRARYGQIRKLADRLAGKNMLIPEKASELDTRETERQIQPVQRAQDPAPPRVLVQEVCYHVCLGSRLLMR